MPEEINPYQAPTSSIESDVSKQGQMQFFTASPFKLSLMSICTFGIYPLYWFYKNWVLIKARTDEGIMPFWRAFFAPIWSYLCFKEVKESAKESGVQESLPVGLLAFGFFLFQVISRLPDPYWLISFFAFIFLIPVNRVAIQINNELNPELSSNDKFSAWNWVGLVLGFLMILLMMVGLFIPEV